jgi:uncharacterized membrane protein YfcA
MEVNLLLVVLVGFIAQMIDGSLGMAYGLSSTTFLLSLGIPPAAASASVHTAEVFTTGISGFLHHRLGNVDRALLKRLVIPGVVGGILGAYVLTSLPGDKIRPWVSGYLLVMGLLILRKALHKTRHTQRKPPIAGLGFAGGFLDAIGGGGWGPVVTSTLVANGNRPRYAVGSVNAAEFFVTVAQTATFFLTIGLVHWKIILALIAGGALAAPLAAHVCKRLPTRALMILVGVLIVGLSLRVLLQLWA